MDITSFDLETNEPRVVSLTDASVDPSRVPGLEPFDEKLAAWETVDVGRYRPRRVRGSYLGRELGWMFVMPSRVDAAAPLKESSSKE